MRSFHPMSLLRLSLKFTGASILMVLTLLVGCKLPMEAEVQGLGNRKDVPLNAVIKVRFQGRNWIAKKYLNRKNFQLSVCKEAGTEDSEPAATSQERIPPGENTKEEPETETNEMSSQHSVSGYVTYKRFESPATEGKPRSRATDVYFIPHADNLVISPLESDTCYRFEVAELVEDGPDHDLVLGTSVTFRTERNGFGFVSDGDLMVSETNATKEMGATNPLLVDFSHPVNPADLAEATHLCNLNEPGRNSGTVCQTDGEPESRRIYLREALKENPDSGFIQASFKQYAFTGSPTFKAATDYQLNVGVMAETDFGKDKITIQRVPFSTDEAASEEADDPDGLTWIPINSGT